MPGSGPVLEEFLEHCVKLAHEHNYSQPWITLTSLDEKCYFLYPINKLNDVPQMMKEWAELIAGSSPEKSTGLYARVDARSISYTLHTYRLLTELSYLPGNMKIQPSEAKFLYMGFCHIRPGHEAAVKENFKRFVEIYTSRKMDLGWATYEGFLGPEMPVLAYTFWDKGLVNFITAGEEAKNQLGENYATLWQELMTSLTRYEYRFLDMRKELSYLPDKRGVGEKAKSDQ